MQRLEVSCAVRRIYMSLGAKGLTTLLGAKISYMNLAVLEINIIMEHLAKIYRQGNTDRNLEKPPFQCPSGQDKSHIHIRGIETTLPR